MLGKGTLNECVLCEFILRKRLEVGEFLIPWTVIADLDILEGDAKLMEVSATIGALA